MHKYQGCVDRYDYWFQLLKSVCLLDIFDLVQTTSGYVHNQYCGFS